MSVYSQTPHSTAQSDFNVLVDRASTLMDEAITALCQAKALQTELEKHAGPPGWLGKSVWSIDDVNRRLKSRPHTVTASKELL